MNRAAVGMVCRGVVHIVKRFAYHCDYMWAAKLENFVRCNLEREFGICPTEYDLPGLAPFGSHRNFNTNGAKFLSGRILKRNVNIAVRFNPYVGNSARQRIPFLL